MVWPASQDLTTLPGILAFNLGKPGFWYSLLYSMLVVVFGARRMMRRRTPYIKWQTLSLIGFQIVPLFLLPYIALPYLGHNGFFDSGWAKHVADALFPEVSYDHGRDTGAPLVWSWPGLSLSGMPSVEIPWVGGSQSPLFRLSSLSRSSSISGARVPIADGFAPGALAETLGDTHRHKMPHGPRWNRANSIGQVILALCFVMLFGRIASWLMPDSAIGVAPRTLRGMLYGWQIGGIQLNYRWSIDLLLAGVVGYGAYFWYSGRVWCRFACPPALMHIYARFSRFRILAQKEKCISCGMYRYLSSGN